MVIARFELQLFGTKTGGVIVLFIAQKIQVKEQCVRVEKLKYTL